jgi:RNA polymerase sigma factor (sigma-70 family)
MPKSSGACEEEIVALLRLARPRLRALFRGFRVSREDAEDMVQEAMLVMLRRWTEIEEPAQFLLGTVRNKMLALLRRRRALREVHVDESSLEQIGGVHLPQSETDCRFDVATLLSILPERGGQIVELRYGEGLSSREIAAELSYSESGIRKIAMRHLRRLRRHAEEIGYRR